MTKKTKTWLWISLIVVALIIGGVVGANLFPKVININSPLPPDNSDKCDYSYYTNQITSEQSKTECYKSLGYWAVNDLTSFKGNYCFSSGLASPSELQTCSDYVRKLQGRMDANFMNCQAGVKANQLTFSVYP